MNLISVILINWCFVTFNCSSIKKLDIFTMEVERQPLGLEKPEIRKLEKLKWIIITSENTLMKYLKEWKKNIDPVIFGLSDKDFQLLIKNFITD